MENLNKKKRKEIWDKNIPDESSGLLCKEWELLNSIEFNLGDHKKGEFDSTINNEINKMIYGGNDA